MSKIDEIIKELCPDGVEKVKIKDAFTRLKGTPITAGVMKEIEDNEGDVIIFAGGKTIIKANEKDIPNASITNVPSVIVQSRGVIDVQYCDTPCTFKNEMWAYTADNSISVKYLFYYLRENVEVLRRKGAEHGSMPQISLSATEDYEIPLPPLSIQQKIVSVLDSFTTLIDKMKQEVEKRKKQMEYYREKLLTFKDGECEWLQIQDICKNICSGGTPSTKNKEFYIGEIPWLRTQEVDWNIVEDTDVHISDEAVCNSSAKLIPACCVIVAMYGATAAKSCINAIPLTTNQACCNLEIDADKALYKYVYYFFCNEYEELKAMGEGSQNNINGQKIKNYIIPVPSLSKQREIVSTLDKFESYITKLEKMIVLRQKQYEYYREQLLTFR